MDLIICLLYVLMIPPRSWTHDVIISTYNIWNIMFNWESRKYRIADMIQETKSDIIAIQEVRINNNRKDSQISELQKLLPDYKWSVYKSADVISKTSDPAISPWDREGVGVLSKKPIVNSFVQYLAPLNGPDTNKRIALHVSLDLDGHLINIIVLHMSYDRESQCKHAAEIYQYITSKKLSDVIILGDMNIYNDYPWPVRIFTESEIKRSSRCFPFVQRFRKTKLNIFYDTWQNENKSNMGLTFSNMPIPGLESRPDRILVSYSFKTIKRTLTGNGTVYKEKYSRTIQINRIMSVMRNSFYVFKQKSGYSCLHDCGPRGSCRCGVCVGGHLNGCELPACKECDLTVFWKIVLFAVLFIMMAVLTLYSALQVLIISAKFDTEILFSIMGFKCCLFNPKLYMCKRNQFRLSRYCKIFRFFSVPPMFLFFVSVYSLFILCFVSEKVFAEMFVTVNGIMEEEFFPSDHLMYTVHLRLNPKYVLE